jgi:isoquinoline 1-oxidoreductase subunit beta
MLTRPTCRTESGAVFQRIGSQADLRATRGAAAKLTPPEQVELKDPKTFKLIGKPIKRLDTPEKLNGKRGFRNRCEDPGNVDGRNRASSDFRGEGEEL